MTTEKEKKVKPKKGDIVEIHTGTDAFDKYLGHVIYVHSHSSTTDWRYNYLDVRLVGHPQNSCPCFSWSHVKVIGHEPLE